MTELQFHLEYFDGPLDLLLHLIKDSKIDIETVFLSDVTEQYLKFMDELDRIDMDMQAEFLSVAATLLEIKSKALLPRYEEEATVEDDVDANELIRRLEEYKIIKELSSELKEIEDVGKLYKVPDPSAYASRIAFKESSMDKLFEAFNKVLLLVAAEEEKQKAVQRIIPKDSFTVEEQQERVIRTLKDRGETTFFALVEENKSRLQLVTMLLAILELIKNQVITISQSEMFEDIDIKLRDEREAVAAENTTEADTIGG